MSKKNPHYDDSQEIVLHTNPFTGQEIKGKNPLPDGYQEPKDNGARVTTQDVKSNEVNTDEPKKRRKSRSTKSADTDTDDKQADSNS